MLKKAMMVFVPVAAVVVFCLVFGSSYRNFGLFSGNSRPTPATLLRQVQTLSQLVTVKYVLEKVVDVRDVKWFGENRVLLVAQGVVKAGINLDNLKPGDLEVSDQKILLTLPHPAITDVYLDDQHTQVLERTTGTLRAFDKDLEQNARKEAVDSLRVLALDNGILKEAQDRAKIQLTNLFHQMGFDVEIKTR
jgi:hypothetical protein